MAGELERLGVQVQFIVPDVPEGVAKLREWPVFSGNFYQASEQEKIFIIEELLAGKKSKCCRHGHP